jgi:hypothetical protein
VVLTKLRRFKGAEQADSGLGRGAFMRSLLGQLRGGTSKGIAPSRGWSGEKEVKGEVETKTVI